LSVPPAGTGTVTLTGVTANGSATQTTGSLTLTFDKAVPGLAASHVTLTSTTGAAKGALSGTGPSYTLAISGVTAAGEVTVAVANPPNVTVSGSPKKVNIFFSAGSQPVTDTAVTLTGVAASPAAPATTTALTLTFDKAVPGLLASHITLSGVAGVTAGTLAGNGPTYTLGLNGVTAAGTLTVAVANPPNVTVSGSPKTAAISFNASETPVTFSGVTAAAGAPTTSLTLTFDKAITGLAAGDITLTGATKGALSGAGPTYTLAISGVPVGGGTVSVEVTKSGYAISGSPQTVTVLGPADPGYPKPTFVGSTGDAATGTIAFAADDPFGYRIEVRNEKSQTNLGVWYPLPEAEHPWYEYESVIVTFEVEKFDDSVAKITGKRGKTFATDWATNGNNTGPYIDLADGEQVKTFTISEHLALAALDDTVPAAITFQINTWGDEGAASIQHFDFTVTKIELGTYKGVVTPLPTATVKDTINVNLATLAAAELDSSDIKINTLARPTVTHDATGLKLDFAAASSTNNRMVTAFDIDTDDLDKIKAVTKLKITIAGSSDVGNLQFFIGDATKGSSNWNNVTIDLTATAGSKFGEEVEVTITDSSDIPLSQIKHIIFRDNYGSTAATATITSITIKTLQ